MENLGKWCSELCPCAGCSDVFQAVIVAHSSFFSSEIASIRADLRSSTRKLNPCLQQKLQRKSLASHYVIMNVVG